MKKHSKLGSINWFDILKTFILVIGTVILGSLIPVFRTGALPSIEQMVFIGTTALAAGLTYLLKQFGTNENGGLLKPPS